jgi:hypothetical protein
MYSGCRSVSKPLVFSSTLGEGGGGASNDFYLFARNLSYGSGCSLVQVPCHQQSKPSSCSSFSSLTTTRAPQPCSDKLNMITAVQDESNYNETHVLTTTQQEILLPYHVWDICKLDDNHMLLSKDCELNLWNKSPSLDDSDVNNNSLMEIDQDDNGNGSSSNDGSVVSVNNNNNTDVGFLFSEQSKPSMIWQDEVPLLVIAPNCSNKTCLVAGMLSSL